MSTLALWLPTWKIDDVTYHTPISPVSTDGKPDPTQPPGISPSNQPGNGVSVDTSPVSEIPQPDDSYTLCGSFGGPSFDDPRALLNTGNPSGDCLLSIVHSTSTAHNDDHHEVSVLHVPPEAGRKAINEGIRRIDEISKVTKIHYPPSRF